MSELLQLGRAQPLQAPAPGSGRERLERRARRLAWLGNGWHLVELAVALAAGIAAGSVALVAFGIDSLIELAAGTVIVWRFSGGRGSSRDAERQAQLWIAVSFFLLAGYVLAECARDLAVGHHPGVSWVGVGLAAFTAPAMPLLARAKRRVGSSLESSAAVREAGQNMLCAYLSVALLVGLTANALLGWWWADSAAAVAIAFVAVREGRQSLRGEGCCDVC